jgi:hypothetical protein
MQILFEMSESANQVIGESAADLYCRIEGRLQEKSV